MNITIRKFAESDDKAVKKCIKALKEWEAQYDPDYYTSEDSVDKLFNKIMEDKRKGGAVFLAESDREVVGFISMHVESKNDELICKKIPTVYVSDICVLPEYRGQGLGERLMSTAYRFAQEKKINYLKLIVFSKNNKAVRFYEKEGFEDYETTMLKKL